MKNGTVYISSRGLKKADKYEINPINLDWSYENDFCSIKDLQVSKLDKNLILDLMENI